MDRRCGGHGQAPCGSGRQRAPGYRTQTVRPRVRSCWQLRPMAFARPARPLQKPACQQILIRRIPKMIPGAPVRNCKRPEPAEVRIQCTKLFESTVHAIIVQHGKRHVHVDPCFADRILFSATWDELKHLPGNIEVWRAGWVGWVLTVRSHPNSSHFPHLLSAPFSRISTASVMPVLAANDSDLNFQDKASADSPFAQSHSAKIAGN